MVNFYFDGHFDGNFDGNTGVHLWPSTHPLLFRVTHPMLRGIAWSRGTAARLWSNGRFVAVSIVWSLPKKSLELMMLRWWWGGVGVRWGYGNGCGAEQTCAETIHRNWLPWAICFMVEVVFGNCKKGPAELDAQLQGEVRAETLEKTRRLSAPFPSS